MQDSEITQLSQTAAPIFITVKVDELFNQPYPSSTSNPITEYTKIESGGKRADFGVDKKPFTTTVGPDENVRWMISFDDPTQKIDYSLELVCITMKYVNSNVDFFDFHPLIPVNHMIMAHTKTDIVRGSEYIYNIIFTITDNYGYSQTYDIDPQLKMQ
ncbi:hypothetical protein SAMN03097699_0922 [Flavobacteriaceae bacterium MAR_2010_188]|nr:hypothetical protein SAMN03097699_0922 [Flavobacteriaceae bacterium MAR_2010_188]